MQLQRIACASCGATISVPPDIDRLNCAHCGTALTVQRGEGYVASKLAEAVSRSIETSGAATVDELRRGRLHQEMLALRSQIGDLDAETRRLTLMGKNQAAMSQRVAVEGQWNAAVVRLCEVEQSLGLRLSYVRQAQPTRRPLGRRVGDGLAVLGAVVAVLGLATQTPIALGIGVLIIAGGLIAGRFLKV